MNPKTTRMLTRTVIAGLIGFALRLVLYRFGFDEKNILSSTHPLHLACLALAALVAVYLLLEIRRLGGSNDPAVNFPHSPLRSLGMLVAGFFIAFHGISISRNTGSLLALARTALAFGCMVSMVLCALVPMHVRKLHVLCRGVICLFFGLDLLCRYQSWSGNPQLPDYTFQVLACSLLALGSYHRLAFDTGLGNRRALLLCCLMGLFLSLVCAAGPDTQGFYLGGAFWAGACMCTAEAPEEIKEDASDAPA